MSEPVPLSFERHGKLKLSEPENYQRFASENLVPVVFQEFYKLATEFPLVFVRHKQSSELIPVAMMGFKKGTNVYCQGAHWGPSYLPASFTVAPFLVTRLDLEKEEIDADVSVDEDSPLLNEVIGEALYDANGEQTEFLKKRIEHVVTVTKQTLQARAMTRRLVDKNLLRSRPMSIQYSQDSPKYELDGIYTIDEEALEALGGEEYLKLRQRGLLPLIYAHLSSLHQISRLARLQFQADQAETS